MANSNLSFTDSSVVVGMEGADESDYEMNFNDVSADSSPEKSHSETSKAQGPNVTEAVTQNVASMMLKASKERAQRVFDIYGNIDMLRPYFDVEPLQVRERLIKSLIPVRPSSSQQQPLPRELYGPLMVVFTLVALLLFQMKISDHSVQEGTLMGTSFATCFGYWLGVSGLLWLLAYVSNLQLSMPQVLSLLGYGLFGHCVVLLLGTVFHPAKDHAIFYLLWAVVGGLATLRMISMFMNRISGGSQKLAVCGVLAAIHMLFLLYLHFSYHKVVEDLSQVLEKPVGQPLPVNEIPAVQPVDNPVVQSILNPTKAWSPVVQKKVEAGAAAAQSVHRIGREVMPRNATLLRTFQANNKTVQEQPLLLPILRNKTGRA